MVRASSNQVIVAAKLVRKKNTKRKWKTKYEKKMMTLHHHHPSTLLRYIWSVLMKCFYFTLMMVQFPFAFDNEKKNTHTICAKNPNFEEYNNNEKLFLFPWNSFLACMCGDVNGNNNHIKLNWWNMEIKSKTINIFQWFVFFFVLLNDASLSLFSSHNYSHEKRNWILMTTKKKTTTTTTNKSKNQ